MKRADWVPAKDVGGEKMYQKKAVMGRRNVGSIIVAPAIPDMQQNCFARNMMKRLKHFH